MAVVNSVIANGMRGTLDNVIIYTVAGQTRIRKKNSQYHDRKSDTQLLQRKKMNCVLELYQGLHGLLRRAWRQATAETLLNGYNLFAKKNIRNFTKEGEVADVSTLVVCCGQLPLPICVEMTDRHERRIVIEWDNSAGILAAAEYDVLHIVCYQPNSKRSKLWLLGDVKARRSDCRAEFTAPAEGEGPFHFYACFSDTQKEIWSDSVYITSL